MAGGLPHLEPPSANSTLPPSTLSPPPTTGTGAGTGSGTGRPRSHSVPWVELRFELPSFAKSCITNRPPRPLDPNRTDAATDQSYQEHKAIKDGSYSHLSLSMRWSIASGAVLLASVAHAASSWTFADGTVTVASKKAEDVTQTYVYRPESLFPLSRHALAH